MQLETKFLRLRTPVELGSRFGDWEVCWLGGWTRDRLSFLVMGEDQALICNHAPAGEHIRCASSEFEIEGDNEKDSIGSAPAEGWCGATESSGRSASDRIH
jgi:hypothetical protein